MLFGRSCADPYLQSHPMPAERVAALEVLAKASPYWDKKDPPELQMRHDLMRAKLAGFLDRPTPSRAAIRSATTACRRAMRAPSRPIALAICASAIAQIDGLIQAEPNNPYFYELKGQALLEGGNPAEAIAPLRRAVQLSAHPTLIEIMLGQALIATNNPKQLPTKRSACCAAAITREPEIAGRLRPARHGLWPQGRPRRGRSCLGAGRFQSRAI